MEHVAKVRPASRCRAGVASAHRSGTRQIDKRRGESERGPVHGFLARCQRIVAQHILHRAKEGFAVRFRYREFRRAGQRRELKVQANPNADEGT